MPFVPRVTQLDAVDLDREFENTVRDQADSSLKWFFPDHGLFDLVPEFQAMLRLYVWKESLWKSSSTIGQSLLGVHFEKSNKWKSAVIGCIYVLCPLVLEKRHVFLRPFRSLLSSSGMKSHFTTKNIETILSLAKMANLVVFLYEGKYPTLLSRMLQWRHLPADPDAVREVSFDYMTRELLWNSFAELFTAIIPLIDISWPLSVWSRRDSKRIVSSENCAECEEELIIPTKSTCGHYFCYYCLQANLKKSQKYKCPICSRVAALN